MKIKFMYFSICLIFINNSLFCKPNLDQIGKESLNCVSLVYMAHNEGIYLGPEGYKYNDKSKRIIGQSFLYLVNSKYIEIDLIWEGDSINKVKIGEKIITLKWKNGKIINIKSNDMYLCDDSICYDKSGRINKLVYNTVLKGNKKIVRDIEYAPNGELSKITYDIVSAENSVISAIFEYIHNSNVITVLTTKNKPSKNGGSPTTSQSKTIYEKENSNKYYVKEPWGEDIEYTFNDKNQIQEKKSVKNKMITESSNYYIHDTIFRTISITKKDSEFVEKAIDVFVSLSNQSAEIPVYEKTKGQYKLDKNDDLIYEKRDMKFREKVNGVWSDWKFINY